MSYAILILLGGLRKLMIYISAVLLSMFLAVQAEKKDNVKYLYSVIVIISLLSGLRDISVGTDTKHYFRIFNNIAFSGVSSLEVGFVYLSKFLLNIFHDARPLFIIYAFITNGLIVKRLWSLRHYASFGAMFFLYITIFYPQSMNILRQYLSLAIVFAATELIENKRYLWFLLCNIVAVTIHLSSIIGIIILLIWLLFIEEGNAKRKFVLVMSIIPFLPLVLWGERLVLGNYASYLHEENVSFSLLIVGRIFAILFFVFVRLVRGNPDRDIEKPTNYTSYISCLYSIGVMISTVGFAFEYVGRVALYFMIFEIPFAAKVSLKEENGVLKLCYLTLALYFFIVKTLIMHEVQIIPYRFYF